MSPSVDEDRLDDVAAMAAVDQSGMLRACATAAAQLRESAAAAGTALADITADDRPRAIVVCGMGGSGIAGDVLACVLGQSAPMPVVVHRGPGLPGWVGAADLVIGVSCSGSTRETLSAVDEARRRAARLVGVGAADSPLAELIGSGRGSFVAVKAVLAPRASLWALASPLLVVAERLGILDLSGGTGESPATAADGLPAALESAAARLEQVAIACRPDREAFVNPAKELALGLSSGLPLLWGSGQCGPVAALRLGCQLAENAKTPAVVGALPEAAHNQVVTLDAGGSGPDPDDDFFRDRVDEPGSSQSQVILLRDDEADPAAARTAEVVEQVAQARGLRTTVLRAEGDGPIERLASLTALGDFASVYLALMQGIDPTPIHAINDLKAALAAPS